MSALGIDVGGTFTDAVLVSADRMVTAKVLSTASQGGKRASGRVGAERGGRRQRKERNAAVVNLFLIENGQVPGQEARAVYGRARDAAKTLARRTALSREEGDDKRRWFSDRGRGGQERERVRRRT